MADEPETVDSEAVEEHTWDTESFTFSPPSPTGPYEPDIAQVLYDSGLLLLVNSSVLHPHGLALGVDVTDGKVKGLSLHRTSDPLGVWFDEETTQRAREKLASRGLLLPPAQRGCKD